MGQERRCKAHFDLVVPITVSILRDKSKIFAVTRNVSFAGDYFGTQDKVQKAIEWNSA